MQALEDRRVQEVMDSLADTLSSDDAALLKEVLKRNTGSELEILQDLMEFAYRFPPVGVRQFIEDPFYLGLQGQVYPRILDDLEELFEGGYVEAVLTGSIGWGKSTFSELATAYMIGQLMCYRNPQRIFDLMQGSVIALINVSVNKENAKKVVFQGIRAKVHNSPFFRDHCPPDDMMSSELRFPNNVWVFPAASGETSILGYNVYGGVMDEVNFMDVIENSKRSPSMAVYDKAVTLQQTLIRRMKSRYQRKGRLPGVLVQISSSKYPDDYTERRIREAQEDPSIFVRRYAQWDTLPADRYVGKWFHVAIGDSLRQSKILDTTEERDAAELEGMETIPVPIEYRRDFGKDLDAAIRDFAGRPTLTIAPYILHRWKVHEAMQKGERYGLEHPYAQLTTTLQDGATLDGSRLLLPKLRHHLESGETTASEREEIERRLKDEKKRPRYVHVDLGTATMAGIAMGHVIDYETVTRRNDDGEEFEMRAPIIAMDMMLQIKAPPEDEIEIAGVRSLIYELRSLGYRIKKVSFDQYQSKDSMQQLTKSGIDGTYLSADTNAEVYNALKEAINEGRWVAYPYEIAYNEIIRLEKNQKTGKVDHPPRGSKDVSDAIAGVCFHCVNETPKIPSPPPSLGFLSGGGRRAEGMQSTDASDATGKELDIVW